jgi:hypothetical protein
MKIFVFASLLLLILSNPALVKAQAEAQVAPAEGDHALMVFDPQSQSLTTEPLDSEDLIMRGPGGGGHGGGGHPGGGFGGGHPGGGFGGHPVGHPGGWHPGGPWRPYPGWHNGWAWDRGWHPGWWRVGIIFPVWVWYADVPVGYWQCTAFNSSMQAFSSIGPDVNQAAYGALYQCGGPNYQQMGCYVPQGYCQLR